MLHLRVLSFPHCATSHWCQSHSHSGVTEKMKLAPHLKKLRWELFYCFRGLWIWFQWAYLYCFWAIAGSSTVKHAMYPLCTLNPGERVVMHGDPFWWSWDHYWGTSSAHCVPLCMYHLPKNGVYFLFWCIHGLSLGMILVEVLDSLGMPLTLTDDIFSAHGTFCVGVGRVYFSMLVLGLFQGLYRQPWNTSNLGFSICSAGVLCIKAVASLPHLEVV